MLSELKIKSLKPKKKRYLVCDGQGLYIAVMPTGEKYWYVRLWENGHERKVSIGHYPDISLKAARELKHTAASRVRDALPKFGDVLEQWFSIRYAPSVAPRTASAARRRINRHLLPAMYGRNIGDIKPVDVLDVVRPIMIRTPRMGLSIKYIISQVFQFAIASGIVEWNPAEQISGALPTPPQYRHYSTIRTEEEARALMRAVRGYTLSPIMRLYLLLLAYTFPRPSELREAEWAEIEGDTWTIPARRMKARREHVVPLSTQARALFDEVRRLTQHPVYCFVLPYRTRPMTDTAASVTMRALGYGTGRATPHSFRGMASTLLNERGWPPDVIERQLSHVQHNAVRAAYNRAEYLPQRREMMQAWADYLDTL